MTKTGIMNDPIWDEVDEALSLALGMYWDGCHKIYLAMDDAEVTNMIELGYEHYPTDLDLLKQWYEQSCGLRFVSAVHTNIEDPNAGFVQLIEQFHFEDELEDEDE